MILAPSPSLASDTATRDRFGWQVHSELLKIRTTTAWRWVLLAVIVGTGQALLRNGVTHHDELHPPLARLNPADRADRAQAIAQLAHASSHAGHVEILGDMLTSGQFFGGLLTMLLAIIVVTSESAHRTELPTYLINPKRGRVLAAKLLVMLGISALFWLATTVINVVVTSVYIRNEGFNVAGTDPVSLRVVGFNLLAYLMWAAFGVGVGALLRSQTAAVAAGVGVYLAETAGAALLADLVHHLFDQTWTLGLPVLAPRWRRWS